MVGSRLARSCQMTNLFGAFYRKAVHFRCILGRHSKAWENLKHTTRCIQHYDVILMIRNAGD